MSVPPPTPPGPITARGLPDAPAFAAGDVIWDELAWRFGFYDACARRHRVFYQGLKVVTLLIGAAVTVLAAIKGPAAVTASLAAVGVAVEGISQLFQFHSQWIAYRRVAEQLRQHAFDYAAGVEPYAQEPTRRALLARAIRTITAEETASWAKTMQKPATS